MQLKKMLKGLALGLSVMIIAACSSTSQQSASDGSDDGLTDTSTGINVSGGNLTPEQQMLLQMQQLQRNNTVYFDLDKYNISDEFVSMLDQHAVFLRDRPDFSVTVEGYTDERGTPEYNIVLGERRANAVKMYLQGRGVPASQISIISYGKEEPAVLGHSEEAYAKNRRAILVY